MQSQLGTFGDTWLAVGAGTMFAAFLLSRFTNDSRKWIPPLVSLLLGVGYGLYEWRMQVWSRTVIAPIRLDLAVVLPVLIAVAVRVWGDVRPARSHNHTGSRQ